MVIERFPERHHLDPPHRTEPPALGIHLLLGEDFPAMAKNLPRNLGEQRVRAILAVARRR